MRKSLLMLLLLATPVQSVWAAGCYIQIGNDSVPNGIITTDLNITTVPQTPLPNSSDLMVTTKNSTLTYWVHQNGGVPAGDAATVRLSPTGTTFTVDSSNKKGWLVDPSIPGLYFTLAANLPKPPQGPYNAWDKTTIYLSTDTSINEATASGWGCSNSSDEKKENGTVAFTLSFYTTSAFNPANASGKKLFATRQQVGVLQNETGMGGEMDVFIYGPVTIATVGCGAFKAENETVNLGETKLEYLRNYPNNTFNETQFNIKLENCYAQPKLVINLSSNQVKNNMLVNTQGTAGGVGIAIKYIMSQIEGQTTNMSFDLTQPLTVESKYLNYDSGNGNGMLKLNASLGVIDKSKLSAGTVYIPAVLTLTHP